MTKKYLQKKQPHKKKRSESLYNNNKNKNRRETNMRASSDSISWRGASIDDASVVSILGTTTTTNTKNNSNKHQCLFAACVPAKECDSEEVKCAFVLFLLSLSLSASDGACFLDACFGNGCRRLLCFNPPPLLSATR